MKAKTWLLLSRAISFMLVFVVLAGCSPEKPLVATQPGIPPAAPLAETPVTPAPARTVTQVSPTLSKTPLPTFKLKKTATPTATPTITPTLPAEARLQVRCLEIAPDFQGEGRSTGVLVLASAVTVNRLLKPGTFLLDMGTGKSIQISKPGERQRDLAVSLDRKFLAYSNVMFDSEGKITREELVIATADGQQQKVIPWEGDWISLLGWLDKGRLAIRISGGDPEKERSIKDLTRLVFNPFTGERQILNSDFPGIFELRPAPFWEGWTTVLYDPALAHVVYPWMPESGYEFTYGILNLREQRVVVTLQDLFTEMSNYMPQPRWSPDGSRLVMKAWLPEEESYELFLVNLEGETEKLTNLAPYRKVNFESFDWSPDGRYIASWMIDGAFATHTYARLVIIDTVTRQMRDSCVQVKYIDFPPHKPLWSPDGKQLVVVDWFATDHKRVYLVDPEQGFAAQVAEDMTPVGWMLAP